MPRYSVVNEGISRNQILTSFPGRPAENQRGIDRFARDVLGRPNVKVVVIDLGVNDVLHDAAADRILTGLRTLVRQAHAHGIKVVGATLMPFGGHPRYSAARRPYDRRSTRGSGAARSTTPSSTSTRRCATRTPRADTPPSTTRGDHLHPSDRGYRRMADTIDLTDLKGAVPARL
ncbi:GDSL-type esterase/lipase family protein [Streptomyces sp. L7]